MSIQSNLRTNGAVDPHATAKAANMLRALANPHRLSILGLLHERPHTVMELCQRLSLRQSLVSQHLARLRLEDIVQPMRRGHNVVYSISAGPATDIVTLIADVFGGSEGQALASINGVNADPATRS